MPIESATYINDLAPTNPLGSDPAGQGDDHLRLIKSVLLATLPNMGGVLGRVRQLDTAQTISAIWNTAMVQVTTSATASVVLTMPASGSVTAGWYVDIQTLGNVFAVLTPPAGGSINGAAVMSIPPNCFGRIWSDGGAGTYRAGFWPGGTGVAVFPNGIHIDGATSISGNAALTGNLTVGGAMNVAGTTSLGATFASSAIITGNARVDGSMSISSVLSLTIGQIAFPATQVPSAGANVLDDYEEGTWTPVLSCNVPGNLGVLYANIICNYTKIGRMVHISMYFEAPTWTHTTASGNINITGLPFTCGQNISAGIGYAGIAVSPSSEYGDIVISMNNASATAFLIACNYNSGAAAILQMNTNHVSGAAGLFRADFSYPV